MPIDALSEIRGFAPEEVLRELDGGAIALDCRESGQFGTAHLPGSINVQFSSKKFAERVVSLVPAGAALLIVAEGDDRAAAAGSDLQSAGLSNVVGYVAGGVEAWKAAGMRTGSLAQMSVHDLHSRLQARECDLKVLDVREPFEWEELGYIEGSILIPLGEVEGRREELPGTGTLAIICEHGLRSSTAASILARHGFTELINVAEGMAGWRNAGYPLID